VTFAPRLADFDILMVDVADLTDNSFAVLADNAHFSRREPDLRSHTLFSHQLSRCPCTARHLRPAPRVKLNVVDDGPEGDIGNRKAVARTNIRSRAGNYNVAVFEAERCDNIALLAVFVLNKGDIRAAVRVVLDADHRRGLVEPVALKINFTIFAFFAAAVMANGDAPVAVSAGRLLERLQQGFFRSLFSNLGKVANGHMPAGRRGRPESFNTHNLQPLTVNCYLSTVN
jgi:hypothetical protein